MPDTSIDNALPPVAPEPPSDEDCCRSGCDPCVFDLHAAAVERYREELRAWEAKRNAPADGGDKR